MGKLLSVKQYAELKGKNPDRVRYYCNSGRLPAIKVGNRWRIDEDTPYLDKRHFRKIPLDQIPPSYYEIYTVKK